MKETPILFTAEMVRAILDGRKTQTRRIVKPQPVPHDFGEGGVRDAFVQPQTVPGMVAVGAHVIKTGDTGYLRKLPYGTASDRLWVKETHTFWAHSVESVGVAYEAGGEDKIVDFPDKKGMPPLDKQLARNLNGSRRKRPAIFMHRWASRLTLEITDLRVQQLQDISEEDAIAEGIHRMGGGWRNYQHLDSDIQMTPDASYKSLWESIHGAGSWAKNPWVWAITFKEIK